MNSDVSAISLAGSVFSTACTAYFWLIKSRRERPSLSTHLLEQEFFLGLGHTDTRGIGCSLAIVYANNSILPDAVLGLRVWVKTTAGDWKVLEGVTCEASTALPLNLPPQQTGVLRLTGHLLFDRDKELEGESNIATAYVRELIASPREFKLETLGLHRRVATDVARHDPTAPSTESFRVRSAA